MNLKRLMFTAVVAATSLMGTLPASAAQADADPVLTATPSVVSPTTGGDVAFVVEGWSFPALIKVAVNSTSLNASCSDTNLRRIILRTDRNGYFNLVGAARGCVSGVYRIEATEIQPPYRTFSTRVTIGQSQPDNGFRSIRATPAVADADGNIAFVITGHSFAENGFVRFTSNSLNEACQATSLGGNSRVRADRNGRFVLPVLGRACIPGIYQLEATELVTPYRTYTTTVSVTAAR
ncbi:hypothetical protein ACFY19_39690 [Streptosporangium saharense]|uniref:Uncharacterized protein n=1 Tax=Streptosporangium saharense TaxID=1706840 RepID=A0A7W7VQ73_9ACTN|nr:hypothetical protein [Streptosporangium saharense]MBB4918691.1 hypothetical protein [Streptosporangium saharense]